MRAALFAFVLTLSASARAFVPDGDGALIVASGDAPRVARSVEPERIAGWDALRDRDTGVVARMWGSYVDAPGSIADAAIAERAARAFVAAHLGDLAPGARVDDFVLASNRVDDGKRTVAFTQTWRGMRVVGGQLHVVFAADRLFVVASDALPNVKAASFPRASLGRAAAWLRDQTKLAPTLRATGERVVLPIVRTGHVEYRIADVADATAKDQAWDVYVGEAGAPIARASRVHFAIGTLQFDVGKRYATGMRMNAPAPFVKIDVDGAPGVTAGDGTFTWASNVAATVTPSTSGNVVRLFDEAGPLASGALTVQPGQPVVWSVAGNQFADAQLHAYIYANLAKAYGKRINPGLAWLDQILDVHVNLDETCNAFSTGDSIHFFRASTECQNTALLADVVEHEFGHSLHQQSIIPGAGGFDFSIVEGIADFFTANIQNDSGIGRGFYYSNDAVREIDPLGGERVYPRDLVPISHVTGLIISGALWDLRKQMIAKYGEAAGIAKTEKIFLGIMQRAGDLTMTYNAALVADDDNGNLGDGTPNGCLIESAFGRHGLAGANFRETTLRPTIENLHVSVAVDTPTATACPPATVTAMKLAWRVGTGALADIVMTQQGATWSADLPTQPDGTVIQFQIVASLDNTETLVFPDNPADPLYQQFIGTGTEIWCERFDTDPGWKQEMAVEWEVAVSNPANAAAGDPEAAFTGTSWLGTDLRGDGRYRADILTSIVTPQIDARAYGRVHLQYRRWLAIEDAGLDVATVRVNATQLWANAQNVSHTLDHIDKEWRFVDFDLTSVNDAPFAVSWTLASDPLRQLGGWNLDDICVIGLDKRAACGDGIVDPGEACDGTADCLPDCTLAPDDDGGCCSTSKDGWLSMVVGLALVQLVTRKRRR